MQTDALIYAKYLWFTETYIHTMPTLFLATGLFKWFTVKLKGCTTKLRINTAHCSFQPLSAHWNDRLLYDWHWWSWPQPLLRHTKSFKASGLFTKKTLFVSCFLDLWFKKSCCCCWPYQTCLLQPQRWSFRASTCGAVPLYLYCSV